MALNQDSGWLCVCVCVSVCVCVCLEPQGKPLNPTILSSISSRSWREELGRAGHPGWFPVPLLGRQRVLWRRGCAVLLPIVSWHSSHEGDPPAREISGRMRTDSLPFMDRPLPCSSWPQLTSLPCGPLIHGLVLRGPGYAESSKVLKVVRCVSVFSHVQLFATPWTVPCQAPLSMEFSGQEYWSGLPFPTPILGFWVVFFICLRLLGIFHWKVSCLQVESFIYEIAFHSIFLPYCALSVMLDRRDENRHSCLVPDFRGELSVFDH